MSLRDLMGRHARGPLVRLDHNGESIVYRPKGGGTPVTMAVVVDRSLRLDPISDQHSRVAARAAVVFVPRGAGVDTVAAGDQMDIAIEDEQGAVVRCRVDEILSSDAGGWTVRVQR